MVGTHKSSGCAVHGSAHFLDPPALKGLFLPTFIFHSAVSSNRECEFFFASPDGDPSRLAIAFSHEKSSEPRELAEELFHRFYLRSRAKSLEHQQPLSWHDIFRGKIGFRSCQHLQLQQADGDHADHARNRFQSCGTLVLT